MNRKKIENRVAKARHQRKSDAENTVVFYDGDDNFIFEVYFADKSHYKMKGDFCESGNAGSDT